MSKAPPWCVTVWFRTDAFREWRCPPDPGDVPAGWMPSHLEAGILHVFGLEKMNHVHLAKCDVNAVQESLRIGAWATS